MNNFILLTPTTHNNHQRVRPEAIIGYGKSSTGIGSEVHMCSGVLRHFKETPQTIDNLLKAVLTEHVNTNNNDSFVEKDYWQIKCKTVEEVSNVFNYLRTSPLSHVYNTDNNFKTLGLMVQAILVNKHIVYITEDKNIKQWFWVQSDNDYDNIVSASSIEEFNPSN